MSTYPHAVWPTPPTSEHATELWGKMVESGDWQDHFKPKNYYGGKYDAWDWCLFEMHRSHQFVIKWYWDNFRSLFNQ